MKGGKAIGTTDEIGLRAADDPVHVHDPHATMPRWMGLDHDKLTSFHQGRDFRRTGVFGKTGLAERLIRP